MNKILGSKDRDSENDKKSLHNLVVLGLALGLAIVAIVLVFTMMR
jgi:hypothetical protein